MLRARLRALVGEYIADPALAERIVRETIARASSLYPRGAKELEWRSLARIAARLCVRGEGCPALPGADIGRGRRVSEIRVVSLHPTGGETTRRPRQVGVPLGKITGSEQITTRRMTRLLARARRALERALITLRAPRAAMPAGSAPRATRRCRGATYAYPTCLRAPPYLARTS